MREFEEMRVDAFAKLTLSLHITGVRPDGYHELDATMVSINAPFDALLLAPARAETARYRELVVDLENNALPPLLTGVAKVIAKELGMLAHQLDAL